eukprot:gene1618-1790_t
MTEQSTPTKRPKRLFTSPKKGESDYTGYVTSVSQFETSANGNKYFDVTLKTSPNLANKVRVMATHHQDERRKLFVDKHLSSQPIILKNLSHTDSGTTFYNHKSTFTIKGVLKGITDEKTVDLKERKTPMAHTESPRKKKVREALIKDKSSHIQISLWQELTNLQEGVWYKITEVACKQYYGLKLISTQNSQATMIEKDTSINWTDVPMPEPHAIAAPICCPNINNVKVNTYPKCNNAKCGKKLNIQTDDQFVTCPSCSRKMLASKCILGMNAIIDIDTDDATKCLTVFEDQLTKFFNEDLIETNKDAIEEKLLLLENVDFFAIKKA